MIVTANYSVAAVYHDVTEKVPYFDYSGYTVTYTNADGEEVTVPLTAEATTPEHMIALLHKVYTDPTIPGIRYCYDYNGTQYRKVNYNGYGHQGNIQWIGSNEVIANPYQDGMTMLQVCVRNDWLLKYHNMYYSNDLEYMRHAYSSIRLITNFTRVNDPQNPGYLFSVDGATNRFFFISKGKPRYAMTAPLYRTFEQVSPVNAMAGDNATESFINDMKAGDSYYCFHDCTNVTSMTGGHWFTISTIGETYNLDNLAIFMPDRRFEYIHDTTQSDMSASTFYVNENDKNHAYYNEYGNSQNVGEEVWEFMPRVLMYNAYLSASVDLSSVTQIDGKDYYTVTLNWSSALTGMQVPEHYWVYAVDSEGNRTLLPSVSEQPTTAKTNSFLVERQVDPQTLHFVVTASTINYETDGTTIALNTDHTPLVTLSAESRICSVTVPGIDPYFSKSAEYRSRFDILNDVNVYKNKIEVCPSTLDDYRAIKNFTDDFELQRVDDGDNAVTVATIRFTQRADESGYDFVVDYNAATQETGNTFDDEQPVVAGTLDGLGVAITIIDRFTASTATNNHSAFYTYRLVHNSGNNSNPCVVPVYKTTNSVSETAYTEQQVTDDVDRNLAGATLTNVTFSAINDPFVNLEQYNVYRLVGSTVTRIGKAENIGNSGNYAVMSLSEEGYLNESNGVYEIGDEGGDITLSDYDSKLNTNVTFVPEIQTSYVPVPGEYNTYGCSKASITYPKITLSVRDKMKSRPFGDQMGYYAKIRITPTLTPKYNEVYYYRVWRVMADASISEIDPDVLLNGLDDVSGTDGNGTPYGTDYAPLKRLLPGKSAITFTDLYVDKVYPTNGKKTVYYIVRMYSRPAAGASSAKRRAPGDGDDDSEYLISQAQVSVVYNNSVTTGLDEVADAHEPVSVTYYDVMGRASDTPRKGVNIVVTRYRDGSYKSEKILR